MRKIILLNLAIVFVFFSILECATRIFIYYTRGSATAGLPERTLYLTYQPFVMFGSDWEKKLFPPLSPSKSDKKRYKILLLGGSTAAFFPNDILANAFRQRFPQYEFDVINGADGGYIARQEVIVASIWGVKLHPDIIITLDGANDLLHRIRMDKAGSFYLDKAYALALKHPFLSPFAESVRYSQLLQGLQRLGERKFIKPAHYYLDAVDVYTGAEHSINILAKGMAAKRLMVLQPFMSFKQPLSSQERNFTAYQYRDAVMKTLYEAADAQLKTLAKVDEVAYFDARYIFANNNETIFSDDVHFINNKGYQILASHIAEQFKYAI